VSIECVGVNLKNIKLKQVVIDFAD